MKKSAEKLSCVDCPAFEKSLFYELESDFIESVKELKTVSELRTLEDLSLIGSQVSHFHCIGSGKVKISHQSDSGRESLIRLLSPGDMCGSLEKNYEFTATAISPVKMCSFEQSTFSHLIKTNSGFAMSSIQRLYKKKNEIQSRLSDLVSKNAKERVIYLLQDLYQEHGKKIGTATEIDLSLSRDELSSMIGVATETFIRVLTDLKKNEVIALNGRKIIVLKPDLLFVK
ncbi:MAG: Crp/Fnr family transcriptional regulator [Bacteriovoracaceae bacterium]|nr:Crp/Fnr family transcriptional regulator [Bacteriovoracaceae bacterium]